MHDAFGLAVASDDPAAIDALTAFTRQLLCHGQETARILDGVLVDPDAPLLQACAAALYLFLQRADAQPRAAAFLAAAQARRNRANWREAVYIDAVSAWAVGDLARAAALWGTVQEAHPEDLLAAKLRQILLFNLGDSAGLLASAEQALGAHAGGAFVHGLHAFGLEQCHRFAEAEAAAQQAVAIEPHDPWAQHAMAHVLDSQGRLDEGLAWMYRHAPCWDACSSFLYTHNWWHTALFHLSRDEAEAALTLFDTRVWGVRKTYVQDQVNAISLLCRLELAGVDVGGRWADVADHATARVADQLNGFLDLHYLYALARAERREALATLLTNIDARTDDSLWQGTVQPLALALVAQAEGRHRDAVQAFDRGLPGLAAIGGSHTQRDLFIQLYLDAAVQGPAPDRARRLLEARVKRLSAVPWPYRRLAEALDQLGDREAAEASRQSARTLRARYRSQAADGPTPRYRATG